MSTMKQIPVASLSLDLHNFRTIPQKNELHAINSMIAINPGKFWALLESLLEDGYHATENIIVLENGEKYTVKEGNRRVGALKILLGYTKGVDIPEPIRNSITAISENWKKENLQVPCSIYKSTEFQKVDKITSLVHAKGEKAGRDQWTAVARARYGRDQKGQSEPGLDLLEKYLKNGRNLSNNQLELWSGDYPLTILNEAIQKLAPHLGCNSSIELSNLYPTKFKSVIDKMLFDIGIQNIGFKEIRDKSNFFGSKYGIAINDPPETSSPNIAKPTSSSTSSDSIDSKPETSLPIGTFSKVKAQASTDPISVSRKLRSFEPKGKEREKLVTLLIEIKKLKIYDHPHAFCFLLRSMFEISAKAYCTDHMATGGPSATKPDGNDKKHIDLLREITKHMTQNQNDKEKTKMLHGAVSELAKPEGLLSVTSMNQLIHNPSFSVIPGDICILFGNIFPLLEQMNK